MCNRAYEKDLKLYGLTKEDKKRVDTRILKNKKFLKDFIFEVADKTVDMLKSDMNANISPQRYYSEVNNRVNSLHLMAKERGLKPCFITFTAPGAFHPTSPDYDFYTPKETALFLSTLWIKFLRLNVFKRMYRETGEKMIYLKVVEPHKSGVPHQHAMIFLHEDFIEEIQEVFFKFLEAWDCSPGGMGFIFKWKNGYVGAINYIMKYINKTFKNAKEDKMTDEAYWFSHHRITRFSTSRSLIPLMHFRKVKYLEEFQDLLKTTKRWERGELISMFNGNTYLKLVFNKDTYDLEEEIIYNRDPNLDEQFKSLKKYYQKLEPWVKKEPEKVKIGVIDVYIDKKHFKQRDGILYEQGKEVWKMSDTSLYSYYNGLNLKKCDYNHYCYCHNQLVARGVLNEPAILKDELERVF